MKLLKQSLIKRTGTVVHAFGSVLYACIADESDDSMRKVSALS
jgi:hypothetical protein